MPGYRVAWVGEFGDGQGAAGRLKIVIPNTSLLVSVLLYFSCGSFEDTSLGLRVIPMAVTGGIFARVLTSASGLPARVTHTATVGMHLSGYLVWWFRCKSSKADCGNLAI